MGNKILVAVFVILFTVFVGEVGYLLYTANQATPKTNEVINPSPTPLVKRNGVQAVDNQTVETIKNLNAGILSQSLLENKYRGEIIEINLEEGTVNQKGLPEFKYALEIGLRGEDEEANSFFYSESEVALMTVHGSSGSAALELSNLKAGDSIEITEVWDLKKQIDHNIVSIDISVL